MAHHRWNVIKPAYEAWKRAEEPPEEGTPLAAWNAVRPEQAEVLKINGIKTVEHVAGLTDAHVQRIPVPNLRELKRQAQMFIDSADQMRFAARLDEKDKQLENLQASQTENLELIASVTCPNILFPYAREVVSDLSVRAGFPPVLLNPINFEALYAQQKQQQAEQANGETTH